MTVKNLSDVIKPVPPLTAEDTLARAVRSLRARGVPALPVAEGNRLIGLVSENDILNLAAGSPDPRSLLRATTVSHLMRSLDLIAQEDHALTDVAEAAQSRGAPVVPVAGIDGRYLGVLLPRDILAALAGEPIVPPIAGLATPLGVYLTTGALRAGAGDFALAATGAALMVINLVAGALIYGLAKLADRYVGSPQLVPAETTGGAAVAAVVAIYSLQIVIFLMLLRVSPLTGIHASEHMVVRAIEEGEDLTLEKVRQMPRVHPRCGTNIMALLILLVVAQQLLTSLGSTMDEASRILALFLLIMVVLLAWRRLGAALQRWVTTRTPSNCQIAAAIRVGEELLVRVQARPSAHASILRRLWNTGFAQVLAGFFAIAASAEYGPVIFAKVWHFLTG